MEPHSILPLMAAIIYVPLFIVVSINRPLNREHKLFLVYIVSAIFWGLSDFFLLSDFLLDYKLVIFRLLICSSLWMGIQLFYFARAYLGLPGGIGIKIGYASLGLLILLAALGLAPSEITIVDGRFAGLTYGLWFIVFLAPIVILVGLIVFSLIKRLRISTNPQERNKLFYLIAAVSLLAIFGFLGMTPIPIIEGYPVSHIGALLTASVLAYAILQHGLVSINSVLRRVLGWVLVSAIGISTYCLVIYLFHLAFDFPLTFQMLVFSTLAALFVAIMVFFLRPTLATMIDYFFYRETLMYRQIIHRFDREMSNILSMDELANKMLSVISKALGIPRAVFLLQKGESGDYATVYLYPEKNYGALQQLTFVRDNPIVRYLDRENDVLSVAQVNSMVQFEGLWLEEREMLANSGLGFLCPIKSRGKLVGILALENKKSGKSFSQEDIDLIKSMAGKAGIVVENARMFNMLQQQQQQVQHLLSEAIHAQESERQRISVDLHDSVAQWLAGASYQAQTVEAMLPPENSSKIRDQIQLVEDTVERSLKELRRVVVDMRPPALDELGLSHALRQSLFSLASEGLHCDFKEAGSLVRLAPEVEITVYRVVQEALTNIRKHAGASRVDLSLEYKEDHVVVRVQDNGKGFNLTHTIENAITVGNIGLLGMRQRLEMLDGTIDIRTREGGGTNIIMRLPLRTEDEEALDG